MPARSRRRRRSRAHGCRRRSGRRERRDVIPTAFDAIRRSTGMRPEAVAGRDRFVARAEEVDDVVRDVVLELRVAHASERGGSGCRARCGAHRARSRDATCRGSRRSHRSSRPPAMTPARRPRRRRRSATRSPRSPTGGTQRQRRRDGGEKTDPSPALEAGSIPAEMCSVIAPPRP